MAGIPPPREGRAALGFIQKVKVRNASFFLLQGFKKTFCAVKRVPEYFFRHSTGNSAGAWGRKQGPAWVVAFSLKALSSLKNSAGAGDLYSKSDPAVLLARCISMQNMALAPHSHVPFLPLNRFYVSVRVWRWIIWAGWVLNVFCTEGGGPTASGNLCDAGPQPSS